MIDNETTQMVKEFENRLRTQGMNIEMYYQFTGQNDEALRVQMRDDAEKRVRNNLVLEAIAKAEGLDVTEAEVQAELSNLAPSYQRTPEELHAILSANGNLEDLKHDLLVRKTVTFLVENSK